MIKLFIPLLLLASCATTQTVCKDKQLLRCSGFTQWDQGCEIMLDAESGEPAMCE
jgi:hypothetical protein